MKFEALVKQLSNRVNQAHVIEHYLRLVYRTAVEETEKSKAQHTIFTNSKRKQTNKAARYNDFYMSVAVNAASLSHCQRRKVGAVLVRGGNILSFGFNGTPSGMSNNCEDCEGKTHWHTLHAEANAILKCAKEGRQTQDAIMYVTCSPCPDCLKLILQAGIKQVYYKEEYSKIEHLDMFTGHVEILKHGK